MKLMHKKLTLLLLLFSNNAVFGCGGGGDPQAQRNLPVVVPQREVN